MLTLFGDYSTTDYPRREIGALVHPINFSYNFFGGGVSYDRHIGGRIEGMAQVSYTVLDTSSSIAPGFRGLTYAFDVNYLLNSRISVHASSKRATAPSNLLGASYVVNIQSEVDVTYKLGPRLLLSLAGSDWVENFSVIPGPMITDLTHQNLYNAFLTASYQLTPRLSFSLRGGDEQRSANFAPLDYNSVRVDVMATATF
jgi:hypothetical protein